MKRQMWLIAFAILACGVGLGWTVSQADPQKTVAPDKYKYSTQIPPGVASPDKVETRLGTLNFFDGVPDQASTEQIYDNLDFQRAVQAYLLALPVVNQVGNRDNILKVGPANTTVPIWENLVDSRTVELTANDNTPYTWFWVDLRKGPLVIEAPPKVLGLADDSGITGRATSASRGRTRARAANTCCCRPATRETCPTGTSSCDQARSACGPAGALSSLTATPSPASMK